MAYILVVFDNPTVRRVVVTATLVVVPVLAGLAYRQWVKWHRVQLPRWRNGFGLSGIVFVFAAWVWWGLLLSELISPVHFSFALELCEFVVAVGTLIAPALAVAWKGKARLLAVAASTLLIVGGQAFSYT